MATNIDVKNALLNKLGILEKGLYKRAAGLRKKLPMTVEDSIHLIAFQEGVPIGKYLTSDQVQSIRHLQTQFVQTNGAVPTAGAKTSKRRAPASPNGNREIRFPNEFKMTNPLLPSAKLEEAKSMAAIYPLLYVVENSMREVVRRVLTAKLGADWWDTAMTTSKLSSIHAKVADRMRTEERDSWHQKRGAHPIDYTDFGHLETIILSKHEHFIPEIISDREWFVHFMKELTPSRNVVCHMNPLDAHNVADIKVRAQRWQKILEAAKDKIPA